MHTLLFYCFGSFLSCFYGEYQGVIALCYAYLADVTRDTIDHRTMRMAFIEASLSLAGIPAGLLSGYLLQQIGYVSMFCLTIGISVLILLYVACLLPDANRPETNQVCSRTNLLGQQCNEASNTVINTKVEPNVLPFTTSSLFNPFHHLKCVLNVITNRECRHIVLPLLFAMGFSVCAVLGESIVQTLYLKNHPFLFSPQTIGYYSAIQSAIRGIGVILITQLSFHWLHLHDYSLILLGLLSIIVCYVLIGLSRSYN